MKSPLALGLTLALLGLLPLLGGPRYEAALLAGLLAPSWTGIQVVRLCLRYYAQTLPIGKERRSSDLIAATLACAGVHGLSVVAVATLHGLAGGFCEPALGYSLLLLGPCFGVLLMSQWAHLLTWILVGTLSGRLGARWVSSLALAAPVLLALGSALLRARAFYTSPTVFAYDPFVGYFSGPLYDTVEYDIARLLSFRVGTVFTLGALLSVLLRARLTKVDDCLRVSLRSPQTGGGGLLLLAVFSAFAFGSTAHTVVSDRLSHTQSESSIRRSLGRELVLGSCRVIFSSGVQEKVAERMAQECQGHLFALSRYFEYPAPERVHVFLFSNAEEKRQLMGAGRTYIAKPWRREIYLQPATFPHQVLGHELAHVFTGQFGQGPFRVAGPLGGFMFDPGRIEGFAVAAAPREHSEGTLAQWAAGMKTIGLLPRLEELFQLSFLGKSAAISYTAAGSFVDFVRRTQGAESLRNWYAGADLEELTGRTWAELERTWHEELDAVELPEEVIELSKPRFSRKGVFERRCPHAVDRAAQGATRACGSRLRLASDLINAAVDMDPLKADLELRLPRCYLAAGRTSEALSLAEEAVTREARYSLAARRATVNFLGNLHLRSAQFEKAGKSYRRALESTYSRDGRRQLDLKLWALDQKKNVRDAIQVFLAPAPSDDRDPLIALGAWFEAGPHHSLAAYLIARRAMWEGRLEEARRFDQFVILDNLPLESVRRETLRTRVLLSCREAMSGEPATSLELALRRYRELDLTAAEEFEALRLEERCARSSLQPWVSSTSLER